MTPNPKSPYALQKLVGEYYCGVFAGVWGVETVALRYFNVYGPRQDPSSPYSGVLSIFLRCAIERRAPTIFGDGEQSRDFTFVEDVAELNLKAASAPEMFRGRCTTAATAAASRSTRRGGWCRSWKASTSRPNTVPPRAGDVRDSQADITAAVRDLGHAPRFSFEEGMRRTLDWYRRQR